MKKDSTLRHDAVRLTAIDPGDAWCGMATLELRGSIWSAFSTVIHATPRTLHETVAELLRGTPTGVIVEKYQQRSVGHQTWGQPKAPRLIGALEYVTQEEGLGFHQVATGNPKDLEKMPFWPIIMKWREHWQHGYAANWQHGLSAWRILGSYMMSNTTFLKRLTDLQTHKQLVLRDLWYQPVDWLENMRTVSERDLVSTPIMWRMP